MKCDYCNQEMTGKVGCTGNATITFPDGEVLPTSPYHFHGICHDCQAPHGERHHPGCDVERCPRCNGQRISCDCFGAVEDL